MACGVRCVMTTGEMTMLMLPAKCLVTSKFYLQRRKFLSFFMAIVKSILSILNYIRMKNVKILNHLFLYEGHKNVETGSWLKTLL